VRKKKHQKRYEKNLEKGLDDLLKKEKKAWGEMD
jgi:hypothetical protein